MILKDLIKPEVEMIGSTLVIRIDKDGYRQIIRGEWSEYSIIIEVKDKNIGKRFLRDLKAILDMIGGVK